MATPTDLVKDYINARLSHVPMPKNSQQEGERYNAKNEDGNNDEYSRRKRQEEEESIPTREEYEANQREAEREMEREMEYNSQRELDDIDQSEPDYDDDNQLEDDEFTGNYFAQPDESEQKESLGNRIRAKYDSFKASASDTATNLSSSFGESFGSAAGAASAKYSRFKRGDPIFAVQSPVRRGKSPSRYISRPGRSISRPYSGGRFGCDDFTLGTNAGYNPYYPVVNEGRQSVNNAQTMDMYLPSGGAAYEGEFSGRKAFKRSEFSDERERYDPFGYGGLSGDGFDNTSPFGSSLMGFGGDNSIFGGSAGQNNVFGNFGGGRTGKMDILGDSGMFAVGDLVSPPAVRKPKTKRKSASKTTKKATAKKATKRKVSRKRTYTGFTLP